MVSFATSICTSVMASALKVMVTVTGVVVLMPVAVAL